MTRLPLALLALALLLPTAATAQVDASIIPEDAPEWVAMEAAIEAAQTDDKLLLVYGYASWCGFCARFDAEVFTDDTIQAYLAEHYSAVRLDIESADSLQFFDARVTGAELAGAMAISGTPTNVFVDTDGALITKLPGYTDPETFLSALQYVQEEAYETWAFGAYQFWKDTGLDFRLQTGELRAPRRPQSAPPAGAAPVQSDASIVPDDAPEWLAMGPAVEAAQADDKLVLVYGYASWCGFCARFDAEVFSDDAVQAYLAEHYAPVRLDIESDEALPFFDADVTGRELAGALGVTGTPTTAFVGADGAIVTKMPGYTDPETFLLALQFVREGAYEGADFAAYVAERRSDAAAPSVQTQVQD